MAQQAEPRKPPMTQTRIHADGRSHAPRIVLPVGSTCAPGQSKVTDITDAIDAMKRGRSGDDGSVKRDGASGAPIALVRVRFALKPRDLSARMALVQRDRFDRAKRVSTCNPERGRLKKQSRVCSRSSRIHIYIYIQYTGYVVRAIFWCLILSCGHAVLSRSPQSPQP